MVKIGEGAGDFPRGLFILEDGVDGEAESDYLDCKETGNEPGRYDVSNEEFYRRQECTCHIAGSQYLLTGANLAL